MTPDVHSYNALMCSFGKLRKTTEACKVYEHLVRLGVKPNAATYSLLVDAHLLIRDSKAALSVTDDCNDNLVFELLLIFQVEAGFTPKETLKKVQRCCSQELDFDSDERVQSLAQRLKYKMGGELHREMLYKLEYSTDYYFGGSFLSKSRDLVWGVWKVLNIWRSVDAVCFDVDSTVCLDEGIDELADFCGAGKAVAEWTTKAMSGSVPFEEALAARLSLFNPSLSQVKDFLKKRPPRISPGIAELTKKLMAQNIDVYLISGGFRQMINPVALQLGIPLENIFANQLLFGSSGEFVGFEAKEPTSRSVGKATAVQQIRKVHDYKALVMIGDGATDLEAKKPGGADLFICYAGVQMREAVAAKADWLVFNFEELLTSMS
ncbi:unnamed protein product [Musa textilis]